MSSENAQILQHQQDASATVEKALNVVQKRMYGMGDIIRLSLVALYTNGHVLLEGNPGLGKTSLVKELSRSLDLHFSRIQFTPDLMPTDIIGVEMPELNENGRRQFRFQHGPIFTNLLLADEINRATPKTQSALLEAMAERQVTVAGTQHRILPRRLTDDERLQVNPEKQSPFMVLATQNPIDHEGTYTLPEAQSDRFMFKILMPTPNRQELSDIVRKDSGPEDEKNIDQKDPIFVNFRKAVEGYQNYHTAIRNFESPQATDDHILNIVRVTNGAFDEGMDNEHLLHQLVDLIEYGLGPRASTALMFGTKAWAFFFNDEHEPISSGKSLAQVVIPVLRHRIKLKYDWADDYLKINPQVKSQPTNRLVDYYLRDLCTAALPRTATAKQHANQFKAALNDLFVNLRY